MLVKRFLLILLLFVVRVSAFAQSDDVSMRKDLVAEDALVEDSINTHLAGLAVEVDDSTKMLKLSSLMNVVKDSLQYSDDLELDSLVMQTLHFECEVPENVRSISLSLHSADSTYVQFLKEFDEINVEGTVVDDIDFVVENAGLYHFVINYEFADSLVSVEEQATPIVVEEEILVVEEPKPVVEEPEPVVEESEPVPTETVKAKAAPIINNVKPALAPPDPSQEVAEDTLAIDTTALKEIAKAEKIPDTDEPKQKLLFNCVPTILALLLLLVLALILWRLWKAYNEKEVQLYDLNAELRMAWKQLAAVSSEAVAVAAPVEKSAPREIVIPDNSLCDKALAAYALQLSEVCARHREMIAYLQVLIDESTVFAKRKQLVDLKKNFAAFNEEKVVGELMKSFVEIHPNLVSELSKHIPKPSVDELLLCICLFLGVPTKDIAVFLGRETRSIESSRNRLRKKLDLQSGEDLQQFFVNLL